MDSLLGFYVGYLAYWIYMYGGGTIYSSSTILIVISLDNLLLCAHLIQWLIFIRLYTSISQL